MPASSLSWTLVVQHCWQYDPTNCHGHGIQSWPGVAGDSFVAPDHDYPAYLELTLTATDSGGLTDTETLRLDPRTVVLTFQTAPSGLQLTVGSSSSTARFTRTVIVGSRTSVSAPSGQTLGGTVYDFAPSWSDGGAATHIIVGSTSTTYTETFQPGQGTRSLRPHRRTCSRTRSPRARSISPGTAATDGVGVTQYLIERCEGPNCTNFVQIATTAQTNYGDSGLPRGRGTGTASAHGTQPTTAVPIRTSRRLVRRTEPGSDVRRGGRSRPSDVPDERSRSRDLAAVAAAAAAVAARPLLALLARRRVLRPLDQLLGLDERAVLVLRDQLQPDAAAVLVDLLDDARRARRRARSRPRCGRPGRGRRSRRAAGRRCPSSARRTRRTRSS